MDASHLLATTLFSETKNPEDAKGIASVIVTRTSNPRRFGGSLEEVIFAPHQFSGVGTTEWKKAQTLSFKNKNEENIFKEFLQISKLALSGKLQDPTGGADHYVNLKISKPNWSKVYKRTAQIGEHTYFKE